MTENGKIGGAVPGGKPIPVTPVAALADVNKAVNGIIGDSNKDVVEKKAESPTTPWEPANKLTIPIDKDPNYVYKWISKSRLDTRLADGWELVHATSGGVVNVNPNLIDGSSLDNTIQRRELILARMPKGLVEARKKHYAKLTDGQMAGSVAALDGAQDDASGYSGVRKAPGKITMEY